METLPPPSKPGDGLSRTFGICGNHPGYKKCKNCGVAGYIALKTILKALNKGLDSQNLKIVSVARPGETQGTTLGLLKPLMKLLRDKGMVVR